MWTLVFAPRMAARTCAPRSLGSTWIVTFVLVPTEAWEDNWIYNSSLMFDAGANQWRMWYTAGKIASAGGEPQFICYATATDPKGPWTKFAGNPIVSPMVNAATPLNAPTAMLKRRP